MDQDDWNELHQRVIENKPGTWREEYDVQIWNGVPYPAPGDWEVQIIEAEAIAWRRPEMPGPHDEFWENNDGYEPEQGAFLVTDNPRNSGKRHRLRITPGPGEMYLWTVEDDATTQDELKLCVAEALRRTLSYEPGHGYADDPTTGEIAPRGSQKHETHQNASENQSLADFGSAP